mgnify:CR=1 FL=1
MNLSRNCCELQTHVIVRRRHVCSMFFCNDTARPLKRRKRFCASSRLEKCLTEGEYDTGLMQQQTHWCTPSIFIVVYEYMFWVSGSALRIDYVRFLETFYTETPVHANGRPTLQCRMLCDWLCEGRQPTNCGALVPTRPIRQENVRVHKWALILFFPIFAPITKFPLYDLIRFNIFSTPSLLNPNLFINALSSVNLKILFFGLPSWGLGVTVPISINPKPWSLICWKISAFLSKPAAKPTGLGN